jgi:hypothetical protein
MKFQPDRSTPKPSTDMAPAGLAWGEKHTQHDRGLGGLLQPWNCTRFEELTPEHFEHWPHSTPK